VTPPIQNSARYTEAMTTDPTIDPDLERSRRNLAGPSEIRYDARTLAESIVHRTHPGRERSLALTAVEEAVLWAEAERDRRSAV
jgi:hypothetical protein